MDLNAKAKNIMDNPTARVAIITIASILAVLLLLGIADTALFVNKIHRGVMVSGVDIGGMDKEEALSKVNKLAGVVEKKSIKLEYKSRVWKVDPQDLKVHIDREKTVQNAFNIGRQGGIFKSIGDKMSLWFKPRDTRPILNYDKERFNLLINKVAKATNIPAEDAQIKIVDGRVAITSSKDGRQVNKKSLINKLRVAMVSQDIYKVVLPIEVLRPDIIEDNLHGAKKTVAEMVKYPITLKYRESTWEVSVQQIADWVDFVKTRQGTHWSLNVVFDKDGINKYLEDITKGIVIEPKDAQFNITDDKVTIIPSSDGMKVNLEKAYNDILDASKDSDKREVLLSMIAAKAKLSTEDANKMNIKEKVSSFTTFYNPAQASRVHNIQLLGGTLDGSIVAPNEVFSFNGTIGPRTAEKGYQEAPAILNGKLVPSLGGGVCQVGTTMFNTIFFGGYEVVERHNHSFYISHYPLGRDATVSWGGPDLKFKNDTPAYVLIKVKTTASSITVSFYSTNQNVKVDYTTEGPTNFKDVSPQIIEDPAMPKGVSKQEDEGFSGRDVIVYRTVYRNGAEVRKDRFFSRYVPKKAVIRVGTGIEPSTEPVTVDSSTTAVPASNTQ